MPACHRPPPQIPDPATYAAQNPHHCYISLVGLTHSTLHTECTGSPHPILLNNRTLFLPLQYTASKSGTTPMMFHGCNTTTQILLLWTQSQGHSTRQPPLNGQFSASWLLHIWMPLTTAPLIHLPMICTQLQPIPTAFHTTWSPWRNVCSTTQRRILQPSSTHHL